MTKNLGLEVFIDHLPDGVLLLDHNWHLLLTNPVANEWLSALNPEMSEDCLVRLGGQQLSDWIAPESSSPQWHEVLVTGHPNRVFELKLQWLEGSANEHYWLILIRENRWRQTLATFKEEVLSVIAHELCTPVTLLSAPLKLLKSQHSESFASLQSQRLLDIALEGSERLSGVVSNVMNIVQLQSNGKFLKKQLCCSRELIDKALAASEQTARVAQVKLRFPAIALQFQGDRQFLLQALQHLIDNAIKFSPPHGTVWVDVTTSTQTCPSIVFTVRDQGRGVPREQQANMYELFQQLQMSESRPTGGLGLGLRLCRLIAEHHGGKLWMESQSEEGRSGTTVFFSIPYQ